VWTRIKVLITVGLVSLAALALLFPDIGEARGGRGGGSHSGSHSRSHSHRHYGSYRSGLFGFFTGTALAAPLYFARPTGYGYPASYYGYPSEPAPAARASLDQPVEETEGVAQQLVTVPGQWIDGRWVPSHDVWVPLTGGGR
jgi:hypothetical protein